MVKSEVDIGEVYAVKVSNKIVPVRIESVNTRFGGYDGVNIKTGRRVRIKTAAKLRYKVVVK